MLEGVWRREAPHVLGALVRRYGDFDRCEDAAQEALAAATVQWPTEGVPDSPRGWLLRVASRRIVDAVRSDASRADREVAVARADPDAHDAALDQATGSACDDTLALLLLCCHPALTPASQVALCLRAVAGLSTAQVAAALLVPEATVAQRISRAKATLRAADARLGIVAPGELPDRVAAVTQVIYLVFNEGYTASAGAELLDTGLMREAVRLARELHRRLPSHGEVAGLLALMLLVGARTPARTTPSGDLVPLEEQDRSRWDRGKVAEGLDLVERTLPHGVVGPFQLQAAIAAVHAGADTGGGTDWEQIVVLYRMLEQVAPSRTVTLNLSVAVGMAEGPERGLIVLRPLLEDGASARHHRTHAVHAQLLERAGRGEEARAAYRLAVRFATNVREQHHLARKLTSLGA